MKAAADGHDRGNEFVQAVYERLAAIYDLMFWLPLHRGRLRAIKRMGIAPGERVLEIGVGTGINLSLYPRDCQVTGVDLSRAMLDKARARAASRHLEHVRLFQMDAADLRFRDNSFDVVYAAYLVSVVPDPIAVVREMQRVCRPGGRLVILNHFRSAHRLVAAIERTLSPLTVHVGFKSDLDRDAFLSQAQLSVRAIEKVNVPRIWSLITCVNDPSTSLRTGQPPIGTAISAGTPA
jgi:phosphatidylethanolamine/phosphatidyl-N-methylethanolamine N-methyltransferase